MDMGKQSKSNPVLDKGSKSEPTWTDGGKGGPIACIAHTERD